MVDSPHIVLRVVVVVHFILTVWASMSECLFHSAAPSYIYMHTVVLAFGVWAIICPESIDAVFMFLVLLAASIIMDIIFLGIYASSVQCNADNCVGVIINTYRFSLGMAILNLLLKPLSCFVLYRLYQHRTGQTHFPHLSIARSTHTGGYSNIDQQPCNPQYVETAAPYSTVDKSPMVH
jgi:hypothetical protein